MLKKFLSLLVVMAVLCTSFSAVSFAKTTENPYEYYPRDIIVTGLNNNDVKDENNVSILGAVISWKNPESENLSKVMVYSVNGTEETLIGTIENPVPGGVASANESKSSSTGYTNHKLVFEFNNGSMKEIYHAGYYKCGGVGDFGPNSGFSGAAGYYNTGATKTLPEVFVGITNTISNSGNNSMWFVSNLEEGSDKSYRAFWNRRYNSTAYETFAMTEDTTYTLSMKVNTTEAVSGVDFVTNNSQVHGELDIPNTNGAWQDFSFDFTPEGAHTSFEFRITEACTPFYIDDLKVVVKDTGASFVDTETFDRATKNVSKPTGITAAAGDATVTLNWTNAGSDTRFIGIYDKKSDGTLVELARMPQNSTTATIKNLENDKTYNLVLASEMYLGISAFADPIAVTPTKPPTDKYMYEPGNVMITGYTGTNYSSRLSWRNPISDTLTSVKVYNIAADGTETLVADSTATGATINAAPDAIQYVDKIQTEASGTETYRLVFNFSDAASKEVVYTGSWRKYSALGSTSFGHYHVENVGKYGIEVYETVTKEEAHSGSNSLKIVSNISDAGGNRRLSLTSYRTLSPNTAYTGTVWIKTPDTATLYFGTGSTAVTVQGSKEWQQVSIPKFTTGAASTGQTLSQHTMVVMGAYREIYIDDLTYTPESDTSAESTTLGFEEDEQNAKFEAPTNITAIEGNGTVTLNWTKPASGKFIEIYEKDVKGNLMLRARVAHGTTSVTLKNVENDVKHTYVLKTCERNVAEGSWKAGSVASAEVYATPIAPNFETTGPVLYSGGKEVQNLTNGAYSAMMTVKNNKIEEGLNTQMIIAVYDGAILESCYVSEATTVAMGEGEKVLSIDGITLSNATNKNYSLKIMLWSGLGELKPLRVSVSYVE